MNSDATENKKSYYRPPMNYSKLCEKYNMEAGSDVEQERRQNELDVQRYGTTSNQKAED
jgi:hypothetical protein